MHKCDAGRCHYQFFTVFSLRGNVRVEFLGFIVFLSFRGGVWDNFPNCSSMWFISLSVNFEFD